MDEFPREIPDVVPEDIAKLPSVALGDDGSGYDPHDGDLCKRFSNRLIGFEDPEGPKGARLQCGKVYAVLQPDARGLVAVLYRRGAMSLPKEPMTAWLRGSELAYVTEGW
jgi:hypothetical protein